ncbi:MAG: lytic transglycosylase domain-containing protein [Burkholderiaceae bacterium]|nr:lytic transglycosylase domain-containing protein [Burkholderiaceae bacterium]
MIFQSKWIAGAILSAACAVALPALAADGDDSRAEDNAFLLLREAVRQDDPAKADFYAERLGGYRIASYVDYYRLKAHFKELTAEQIRDFLKRYDGSAIADRLRNDWLLDLGRKRDWANFDEQYPRFVLNDDTQVKCYALQSRVLKGQRVASEARGLLIAPNGYGEACAGLIGALAQSGQFDESDLLAQLRLAGEANATGQARRIMALLGGSETNIARAIDLPALALAKGPGASRAEHEIFLVAVGRMAKTSTRLAQLALKKAAPELSAREQATGWANIALQASYSLAPETAEYWRRAAGAPLSRDQMQWKTRIALREENWAEVQADINAMPPSLKGEAAWTYWLGRAIKAQAPGHASAEANEMFRRIADQTNFYGQLATEELGRQVTIPPAAAPVTPAEIAPMAANPGLQRALKFFGMRLRFEGTREWNWELRKMGERELLAAAEFARQNNILDRMVNTSERTRLEFDYTQRFPSPHHEIMHPTTQTMGLDKAWVYGLIRQESRFIMDAQSNVGASGLMQVMPSTARYVAKKIGLTEFVQDMLTDVRTNILLGTSYMNMVLGGFEGSQVLATAAYNAGPGRPRSWRSTLTHPVEGAIFAETIPFSETRGYVKNVMSNATYYAALFENRPQSLKARLGSVAPKIVVTAAELP